jgi:hypothetical protein
LPGTPADAEALVRAHTRRDPAGPGVARPDLSPASLLERLSSDRARVIAGHEAIVAYLEERMARAAAAGRSSYLLWGTFHDSAVQVEAFRRLLGPEGLRSLSGVVVEQLDADGRWRDLPAGLQAGDDAAIEAFLRDGDAASYRGLAAKQRRVNYTGWKYGYVPVVLDLLVAARAHRTPVRGCDMPRPLQRRAERAGELLARLRELHCLLALESTRGVRLRRVAMLWGQDHVAPHGLRRFIPEPALVLSCYVLGGRPGTLTPEARLRPRLVVNDPLLLALDEPEEQLAVLLPGADLGGELERARGPLEVVAQPGRGELEVGSTSPGTLLLGTRRVAVGPRETVVELPAGAHTYRVRAREAGRVVLFIGAVEVPAGGRTRLLLDARRRSTSLYIQERATLSPR